MHSNVLKSTALSLCALLISPRLYADSPSAANLSAETKADYESRISSTKAGAGIFYVAGTAGVIGGVVMIASGVNQRNNAKFKQKGNIITNEDDVNDGNSKVAQGSLIELGGALFIVGGILMSQHVRHLREDAENKGYTLSFVPTTHGTGGMLAYAKQF
jgi:hypothetical protein